MLEWGERLLLVAFSHARLNLGIVSWGETGLDMFPLPRCEGSVLPESFPTGLIPASPEDMVPNAWLCRTLFGLMLLLSRWSPAGEYGGTGEPDRSLPPAASIAASSSFVIPWVVAAGVLAWSGRAESASTARGWKNVDDTSAPGISSGSLPGSSNREVVASAGTSVGCLLSPSNSDTVVLEPEERVKRLKMLRLFEPLLVFSESRDFLLLKQKNQIPRAATTTPMPTPTPIPACAPAERPDSELIDLELTDFGPVKMLSSGRVIAYKATLFTASSVNTACESEKLFLS